MLKLSKFKIKCSFFESPSGIYPLEWLRKVTFSLSPESLSSRLNIFPKDKLSHRGILNFIFTGRVSIMRVMPDWDRVNAQVPTYNSMKNVSKNCGHSTVIMVKISVSLISSSFSDSWLCRVQCAPRTLRMHEKLLNIFLIQSLKELLTS